MISKENMVKLIKVEDSIVDIAKAFSEIWGSSYNPCGMYGRLDLVNEIIRSNSHQSFQAEDDKTFETFMGILYDKEKSPEERTEILRNGV
ncbi:MAG: hypothetical protein IJD40_15700 [Lachnospiraceae bacterium]|nr:hypothetical protein [Lachnospiraceae bacterium]